MSNIIEDLYFTYTPRFFPENLGTVSDRQGERFIKRLN